MKNLKYKTVIFDLDGTLLNTLGDLTAAVNYACTSLGYSESSEQEVVGRIGDGVMMLLKRCLPEGANEETTLLCRKLFGEYYDEHLNVKTQLYDEASAILSALKKHNIKMGTASNKYHSAVKRLITQYCGDYIECAMGEGGEIRRKPHPDSLLAVMNGLGAEKESCIYIGDSDTDVFTAHNAGVKCIGVTWGYRSKEVLSIAGADYIANTADDVLKILGVQE